VGHLPFVELSDAVLCVCVCVTHFVLACAHSPLLDAQLVTLLTGGYSALAAHLYIQASKREVCWHPHYVYVDAAKQLGEFVCSCDRVRPRVWVCWRAVVEGQACM
jgi:hypothetical protein